MATFWLGQAVPSTARDVLEGEPGAELLSAVPSDGTPYYHVMEDASEVSAPASACFAAATPAANDSNLVLARILCSSVLCLGLGVRNANALGVNLPTHASV